MSAVCPHPNCGKPVDKQADGTYPSRCPHCGLLLQPATKQRRARTAASVPAKPKAKPPAKEKPKANDDPFGIQEKSAPASDNPFASAPASKSDNPFASAPKERKERVVRSPASDPLPTTPTAGASLRVYPKKQTDYSKWVTLFILAAVFGGGGFYVWKYTDLLGPGSGAGSLAATFANPAQNYSIGIPNLLWKRNDSVEKQDGYDLYFERESGDQRAWITVRSGEAGFKILSLGAATDSLLNGWKKEMSSFDLVQDEEAKLGGKPARHVTAVGELLGMNVRRDAYVLLEQGLWYHLVLTTEEGSERFSEDFAVVRDSFSIVGSRPGWQDLAEGPTKAFTGLRAPYQIQAPAGQWKENPGLRAESRYSDLKLVGEDYSSIVVVPRQTTIDLQTMVQTYMRFKRRRFDAPNQVMEKRTETDLTIDGKPAHQLHLIINKIDGQVAQMVTFIKDKEWIYIIECEAPVETADELRPVFARVTNSFEVLDEIVEREVPQLAKADEPAPESPAEKAPAEGKMQADDSAPSTPAKTEAKSETKSTGEQPAMASAPSTAPKTEDGKRPSLDSLLGSDTAPKAKAEPKQPAKAASESPAPTDLKRTRSLDDLDF